MSAYLGEATVVADKLSEDNGGQHVDIAVGGHFSLSIFASQRLANLCWQHLLLGWTGRYSAQR